MKMPDITAKFIMINNQLEIDTLLSIIPLDGLSRWETYNDDNSLCEIELRVCLPELPSITLNLFKKTLNDLGLIDSKSQIDKYEYIILWAIGDELC